MVLTRRLLALLLLIPATMLAENTAPVAVHSALRVSLPASPAYHTSTKATRVTAHSRSRLVATRAARRRSRFRRIVWNPLLKGSHESLLKQNAEIDEAGLPRIENDDQLEQLIESEELVPLERSSYLNISTMRSGRPYARPVVRDFLDDLGRAYYEQFHQPVTVTSAVRTAEQQHKLRRRNKNAAPEEGETASSHLSGLTVDLAKRGLTKKQHTWLERYLADLKSANVLEPAEERRQACFHVMIFERYAQWREGTLAQNTAEPATE